MVERPAPYACATTEQLTATKYEVLPDAMKELVRSKCPSVVSTWYAVDILEFGLACV
jgi:hypothetical protein